MNAFASATERYPRDSEKALEALSALSPARADFRDDWLRVGMGLHSADSGQGMLSAWIEFSRLSETVCGRPCLWENHPRSIQSRVEIERAITDFKIKILLVDSFYMSFAGMDENSAKDMSQALDFLASLTVSHGAAIILVHHFGKSGAFSRGSSVFQGWGETDLAIAPVESDPNLVKITALMRCASAGETGSRKELGNIPAEAGANA
jgi:hypothetical protein